MAEAKAYQDIMNMINGRVWITESDNGYIFEHTGGDIIGVSLDLLRDAKPELLSADRCNIYIGPYRAKILQCLEDVYIAEIQST